MPGRAVHIFYVFLGVLSLLVLACMLASGPLVSDGVLRPLAHQRLGYVGMPIVVVYVGWSVLRTWRRR